MSTLTCGAHVAISSTLAVLPSLRDTFLKALEKKFLVLLSFTSYVYFLHFTLM